MAKFKTISKELEADQWTTKFRPEAVIPKAGIMELGFVDGADGKRRECKQGDFIVKEVGGAYPMDEREFVSRFEEIQDAAPVPVQPVPDSEVVSSDSAPGADSVADEVKDAEVQS